MIEWLATTEELGIDSVKIRIQVSFCPESFAENFLPDKQRRNFSFHKKQREPKQSQLCSIDRYCH